MKTVQPRRLNCLVVPDYTRRTLQVEGWILVIFRSQQSKQPDMYWLTHCSGISIDKDSINHPQSCYSQIVL